MMAELGCNLDFETVVEQITGTSMKENLQFFTEKLNRQLPVDFEKNFRKLSFEAYKSELKPIAGIHSLINKVNVPFCTASSGPQEKIRLNLSTTGLSEKFGNNIFSSYDIGSWKPDPAIYLYAAGKMGFKPEECAVVEDSLVGVQAAVKGGFTVFALSTKEKKDPYELLGATVFSNMEELGNLLEFD